MRWILGAGVGVGVGIWLLIGALHMNDVLRSDLGGRLLMLSIFIHVVGLVVAMVAQRARVGGIGFAQLLATGMAVSFIASLFVGLGWWVFLERVDPGHVDWIVETAREQIESWDAPPEEKQQALTQMESIDAVAMASQAATNVLIYGLVFSLMLAAVLRMGVLRSEDRDGAGNPASPAP